VLLQYFYKIHHYIDISRSRNFFRVDVIFTVQFVTNKKLHFKCTLTVPGTERETAMLDYIRKNHKVFCCLNITFSSLTHVS